MADNTAQIAKLRAILQASAREVMVDGRRVAYDLAEVRRQLRELELQDDAARSKRPVAATIKLGGF